MSNVKENKKAKQPLPLVASIAMYVIAIALAVATAIGNVYAIKYSDLISVYFNQPASKVVSADNETTEHFVSDYATEEDRQKALAKMGTDILREGITLLKNDNGVLPLDKKAKISVFGQDSVDPVFGGGGAGSIDASKASSLLGALKDAGFDVNPTLINFYEKGAGKNYRRTSTDAYGKGEFAVNEVPQSAYTDEVKQSFSKYNDAAVVVIGRKSGFADHQAEDRLHVSAAR